MRIAIIQETVDWLRGGAETSTLEMARALAQAGADVTVVSRGADETPSVSDNVSFVPVVVHGFSRALRTYRFVRQATLLCQRGRFDIVHAVTPCLAANVYQPRGGTYAETVARTLARAAAWTRGFKAIGRRFNIRQRFLLRLEKVLLTRRRERVIVAAVSEYVKAQVLTGYGFPEQRVRVVFNGVTLTPLSAEDAERARRRIRASLGIACETPLVLFAAHNFPLKGLPELLRARARAPQGATWQLAVVGRDRPDRYDGLARRLGIRKHVHFVGTREPMPHWYAAVDALAHPTWYDPCSRVVLEALSSGVPVVTTRFNGAAEVMDAERHGVALSAPDDLPALAAAVEQVLQPGIRAACQADAGRMREYASMRRHASELLALYDELLSGGLRGAS